MLGFRVVDEQVTARRVGMSHMRRTMHLAVVGKSGTGKTSFIKHLCAQSVGVHGMFVLDLHGDITPFLLSAIAAEEWRRQEHLSDRLIVISPADREASVGLNPLEDADPNFARIAEIAEMLRERWSLDHFGARTEELLRNGLYVLSASGLTLLELASLLTNPGFRAACLRNIANDDVRQYFEARYGKASEPMQAVMREPILNKITAFTSDPRFRHIVGQARSTFSFKQAMDEGYTIIANFEKGKLGAQTLTLASLVFTAFKNAIFTREKRSLFAAYCDEMQNFIAYSADIETMLSEARKFGVGIVSANQYLDQLPPAMRGAILSVGTHAFFQLSSADANTVSQMLDGGRSLAERLKNLPQRHFIVKSGAEPWAEACVPQVREPGVAYTALLNRSRARFARPRAEIERDIAERRTLFTKQIDEVPDGWR
ncbi:MAG TPA: DUF87 domain-containing protein [Bryobacteraceae bacterium]|nr:DUF87 domain-containing protein [Bryobacteraceae bacterium]